MRRTYWYAGLAELSQAMSEDAVQRSRWTFCDVVNLSQKIVDPPVVMCYHGKYRPIMWWVFLPLKLNLCKRPVTLGRKT